MIFLSEEVLEIICDYFQMNEYEKNLFTESLRSQQSALFFTNFLIYYETHKNELEKKHMDNITEGIEDDLEKQQKFMQIFAAEMDNNPQCMEFISQKLTTFVTDIIYQFSKYGDKETIEALVEKLFMNIDVVQAAVQNKVITSPETLKKLVAKNSQ